MIKNITLPSFFSNFIIIIMGRREENVRNYYNNLGEEEFRTLDAWVETQHHIH